MVRKRIKKDLSAHINNSAKFNPELASFKIKQISASIKSVNAVNEPPIRRRRSTLSLSN